MYLYTHAHTHSYNNNMCVCVRAHRYVVPTCVFCVGRTGEQLFVMPNRRPRFPVATRVVHCTRAVCMYIYIHYINGVIYRRTRRKRYCAVGVERYPLTTILPVVVYRDERSFIFFTRLGECYELSLGVLDRCRYPTF